MTEKCVVCGFQGKDGILPGLRFQFLVNSPIICERCVAEKLGIKAEWNSFMDLS